MSCSWPGTACTSRQISFGPPSASGRVHGDSIAHVLCSELVEKREVCCVPITRNDDLRTLADLERERQQDVSATLSLIGVRRLQCHQCEHLSAFAVRVIGRPSDGNVFAAVLS